MMEAISLHYENGRKESMQKNLTMPRNLANSQTIHPDQHTRDKAKTRSPTLAGSSGRRETLKVCRRTNKNAQEL
jgi:hypothetical protein